MNHEKYIGIYTFVSRRIYFSKYCNSHIAPLGNKVKAGENLKIMDFFKQFKQNNFTHDDFKKWVEERESEQSQKIQEFKNSLKDNTKTCIEDELLEILYPLSGYPCDKELKVKVLSLLAKINGLSGCDDSKVLR